MTRFDEERALDRVAASETINPSLAMAVADAILRSHDNAPPAEPSEERPQAGEAAVGLPVEALAKLRELVRNTENVGRRFPEEARKMHYQEVPPRAIRGQASHEEAKALSDEGIEFTSLPPFLSGERH